MNRRRRPRGDRNGREHPWQQRVIGVRQHRPHLRHPAREIELRIDRSDMRRELPSGKGIERHLYLGADAERRYHLLRHVEIHKDRVQRLQTSPPSCPPADTAPRPPAAARACPRRGRARSFLPSAPAVPPPARARLANGSRLRRSSPAPPPAPSTASGHARDWWPQDPPPPAIRRAWPDRRWGAVSGAPCPPPRRARIRTQSNRRSPPLPRRGPRP